MNYKGRYKLYALIGLTLMLIIQAVVFMIFKPEMAVGVLMLFGLIVLLGLVAVVMSYKSLKDTQSRVKDLSSKFKEAYIDANELVGMSTMPKADKKETMLMILEIFESADNDQRTVDDVTKGDFEAFMQGFVVATGGKMSMTYIFAYSTMMYIAYILFMKLYKVVRPGGDFLYNIESEILDFGIIAVYGIIAFVFLPWVLWVMNKATRERWSGFKKVWVVVPFALPIILMMAMILITDSAFLDVINMEVPLLSSPFKICVAFLLLFGTIIVMKIARRDQFKKGPKIIGKREFIMG